MIPLRRILGEIKHPFYHDSKSSLKLIFFLFLGGGGGGCRTIITRMLHHHYFQRVAKIFSKYINHK